LCRRIAALFLFDEVLQEAQHVTRGLGQDSKREDCAVGARADDLVVQDAWRRVGRVSGAAPGRADGALLDADDSAGEEGFEDGGCSVLVGAVGGVVEACYGGACR
jgi:hypothetical protein